MWKHAEDLLHTKNPKDSAEGNWGLLVFPVLVHIRRLKNEHCETEESAGMLKSWHKKLKILPSGLKGHSGKLKHLS